MDDTCLEERLTNGFLPPDDLTHEVVFSNGAVYPRNSVIGISDPALQIQGVQITLCSQRDAEIHFLVGQLHPRSRIHQRLDRVGRLEPGRVQGEASLVLEEDIPGPDAVQDDPTAMSVTELGEILFNILLVLCHSVDAVGSAEISFKFAAVDDVLLVGRVRDPVGVPRFVIDVRCVGEKECLVGLVREEVMTGTISRDG